MSRSPTETPASRARAVEPARVRVLRTGRWSDRFDEVVGEEPLEIRVAGPGQAPEAVGVTMRTPGHDFELAVGFLLSEDLLQGPDDVRSVSYCERPPEGAQRYNIVTVKTARMVELAERRRTTTVTASCGICGTATLEQLERRCEPAGPGPSLSTEVLTSLPERLRAGQRLFERTGGLHAAGLFDAHAAALAVREDVGRHNAVDKLLGWAALGRRLPLGASVLVVSGRVSFEIVQKAAVAGLPVIVAVSAPSSLAVTTARRLGMTLACFVRPDRANVYSGAERIS